jgi:hydrogenase/urease accessory protein HupE
LLPAKQGTAHVVGDSVFVAISLPVSALHGFDDDGDGVMSTRELSDHQAALRAEIERRLILSDGDTRGATVLVNLILSPGHAGPADRADQVVALDHVRFSAPPTHLRVTTDLFGTQASERQLTITASREGGRDGQAREVEAAVLSPSAPSHDFFRPLIHVVGSFVRVGMVHVLEGTDHLLFLFTLLVAGRGLGYWLRVVTAFTVAHSVTLAAAALGYVHVSPRIVEPLIAISIVVAALDNLLRGAGATRRKAALAGACGLLHGLGFAGSMDGMGLDRSHALPSLLGFNLGVEIGQGACVALWVACLLLVGRIAPRLRALPLPRVASVGAAVVGVVWVVERTLA